MKKISYSLLAFSLSCFSIPLYIHLANFYFNQYQISLALISLVIFLCRFCDCIFDPLIGYLSDYLIGKKIKRTTIILIGSLPLFLNFYFIFNPFYSDEKLLIYWLGGNLILLYFSLSIISINYESIISTLKEKRSEFIAAREFMQILGILMVSILPSIIAKKLAISYDQSLSYLWVFILPIFALGLFLLSKNFNQTSAPINQKQAFPRDSKFWKLSAIYLLNSIAVAIPAVTIRFYVDEHLKVPDLNGNFLGLYFLSAAFSVFIWVKIIAKIGQEKSWIISALMSAIIFIFASLISAENYQLFYLICFLSGFAVGCDLTAPQLILVKLIKDKQNKTIHFAIFGFITKISLAIATLISLTTISNQNQGLNYAAIPIVYAIIPSVLKILTAFFIKKI
jgi:GPH family glycoside/pentoside/hexuronide:cation symporter